MEPNRRLRSQSISLKARQRMQSQSPYTVIVAVDFLEAKLMGAVYEVKIDRGGKLVGEGVTPRQISDVCPPSVGVGPPLCKLFDECQENLRGYFLECARFDNSSDLYIVPVTGSDPSRKPYGFIFNTDTESLFPFTPPKASKSGGIVISAYAQLYFLAHPLCFPRFPCPSFERYDPNRDAWETLPSYEYSHHQATMRTIGYAVCYRCILLSAYDVKSTQCVYKVFHTTKLEWYQVEDPPEYPFSGRATVVGDSIYALPRNQYGIMVFSLRKSSNAGGDVVYSLGTPLLLDDLHLLIYPPYQFWGHRSSSLVHLGSLVFCLLETAFNSFYDGCQHICVTTFQIEGESLKTLDLAVRAVDIRNTGNIGINFCYAPDCDDFEPEEPNVAMNTMEQPEHGSSWTSDSGTEEGRGVR